MGLCSLVELWVDIIMLVGCMVLIVFVGIVEFECFLIIDCIWSGCEVVKV